MPGLPEATDALRAAAMYLLAVTFAVPAYRLSAWCTADRSTSVRLAGTGAALIWMQAALFEALSLVHAFALGPALVCSGALTLLSLRLRVDARELLKRDLRRAHAHLRRILHTRERYAALLLAAVAALRLGHGLVAPPLAWDALTYHLTRAARWVQAGAHVRLDGPDAWSYYDYFPAAGDTVWAWSLLPLRTDLLVAPVGFALWGLVGVGLYATVRALGGARSRGRQVVLAVLAAPALMRLIGSGYAELQLLASLMLGLALVIPAVRGPLRAEVWLGLASLLILPGIKPTGLPALAVIGVFLLARTLRAPPRRGVLVLLVPILLALPWSASMGRSWVEHGSPLYPFPVRVAGATLSEGNPQLADLAAGRLVPHRPLEPLLLLRALLPELPGGSDIGPGAVLFLAVGGLMHGASLVARTRRLDIVLVLLVGLASLAGSLDPGLWSLWPRSATRFLLPSIATWALMLALSPSRLVGMLLLWVSAAGAFFSAPRGLTGMDLQAFQHLLLAAAPAAAAVYLVQRFAPRCTWSTLGGAMLGAMLFVPPALRVRETHRAGFYAAARRYASLNADAANAYPVWRSLDDGFPHRIAVTGGFLSRGHNWLLYPLLGGRLQNSLQYVPVSRSGEVLDYARGEAQAQADYQQWLRRLDAAKIQVVVAVGPPPPEASWMAAHPERFRLRVEERRGGHFAYDVLAPPLATEPKPRSH